MKSILRAPTLARVLVPVFALALAFGFSGCSLDGDDGAPRVVPSDNGWTPVEPVAMKGWPAPRWPADNPYSAEKAILGRRLFFNPELSRDGTISCGNCHQPEFAFIDAAKRRSNGVAGQFTTRNSPTLANLVFQNVFMFEGGVPTLELQALAPLMAHNEMDMTGPEIESRLAADTVFVRLFRAAYGSGPITLERVTKALATYQRTLVSASSPFDLWQAGDQNALSAAAKRGAEIFLGEKGDCWHCHAPPLFTNSDFHNIGLDSVIEDLGRALVTGRSEDEGKFKTPTLRNVGVTAPYMHDGRMSTLEEVVELYNTGGAAHGNKDPLIRPLGLNAQEVSDLVAFLEALTDTAFLQQRVP